MNIQELEDKHKEIETEGNAEWHLVYGEHTKLSVEFAISILNDIQPGQPFIDINDKIQELKTYLDE